MFRYSIKFCFLIKMSNLYSAMFLNGINPQKNTPIFQRYQSKRKVEGCCSNPKGSLPDLRSETSIYTQGLLTSYMQRHLLCQAS